MATEAQRARRRRNRQRRAAQRGNQSRISTNYLWNKPGRRGGIVPGSNAISALHPALWLTEVHSFVIDSLIGTPVEKIWCVRLNTVQPLRTKLNTSGEYRLLSVRCTYNPITAKADDRVGIAPYFDPINKLGKVANFLANGRPLRKGDSRFSESWTVASEITSVIDIARPADIIGGVCVYFHKDGQTAAVAQTDAFLITCDVTYQVRGKKSDLNTYGAN